MAGREMYLRTGSLDLVERQLDDLQWQRCKINETIYRLGKEFEVLPEVVPATASAGDAVTISAEDLAAEPRPHKSEADVAPAEPRQTEPGGEQTLTLPPPPVQEQAPLQLPPPPQP